MLKRVQHDGKLAISRHPNGFTMVEMLVVLFIIGLMISVAVMTLPSSRAGLLDEAERFAGRVLAARDNAILQSRPMAVSVDRLGYHFEQRRDGAWTGFADGPFEQTPWRDGTVAAASEATDATDARLVFDPVGLASNDLRVRLNKDGASVAVVIDRSGAVRVGE